MAEKLRWINFRLLFWGLAAASLIAMPLLSLSFGITWDEWLQGHYGKLILRYLLSGGKNHDFMQFAETAYLYGGLFDTFSGFLYSVLFDPLQHFAASNFKDTVLGTSRQDISFSGFYEIRHILNALTGWAAVFFSGLLARKLMNWRAAVLTVLFLLLAPRFLGHSMNNPKDIPFAAAYMLSLFFTLRWLSEWPKVRLSTLCGLSLGFAAAIGTRIGGIILIFYFALFSLVVYFQKRKLSEGGSLRRFIFLSSLTVIAGYAMGLIFWPYAHANPILNPLTALKTFSNFAGAESQIFFAGRLIENSHLPWFYLPLWMGMTIPLAVLMGLGLLLLSLKKMAKAKIAWALLLFAFLFPFLTAMIKRPIMYNGWRHFLFLYPLIAVFAAAGWEFLIEKLRSSKMRKAALAGLALSLYFPLSWMIRNHPNEYVYFNALAGGVEKADMSYETDYWGNCLREAAEWLGDYHNRYFPNQPAIVFSDGSLMSSYPFLARKLGNWYIPHDRVSLETPPHYALLLAKSWRIKKPNFPWPPPGTLYEVKADSATLCAVVAVRS